MKKVIGLVIGVLPVSAFAECVPVPDCASIGYTETSCEGDSLRCPFDTSKLKCFPCDSSFRYSCSGDNVVSAVGAACNNKYVSCKCEIGTIFVNGECICDSSCATIGNIYYSDGSCSSCNIANKIPVGLVIEANKKIMSIELPEVSWSAVDRTYSIDIGNVDDAKLDMNGKANTEFWVEEYGADADITRYAAIYCYNLAPSGMETTKNSWYLPAAGELAQLFAQHYNKLETSWNILGISLSSKYFWSSTSRDNFSAWNVLANEASVVSGTKTLFYRHTGCFLEI